MKKNLLLVISILLSFFGKAQTKNSETSTDNNSYFYVSEKKNEERVIYTTTPLLSLDINFDEIEMPSLLKSGSMFYEHELDYNFRYDDTINIKIQQKDTLKVRMGVITGYEAGAIGAVFKDTTQTEFKLVGEGFLLSGLVMVGGNFYYTYAVDFYIIANNSPAIEKYEHDLLTFAFKSNQSLIPCVPAIRKCYIDITNGINTGTNQYTISDNNIKVFPNPAYNILNIEGLTNEGTNLMIIDFNGKIAYSDFVSYKSKEVNVSSFTPGIYFLKILGKKTRYESKIIIK